MAALSAFTYALPCTNRALHYFPQRVREGLFLRVEHDDGVGIGEFAPLLGIHRTTVHDAIMATKLLDFENIRRAFCSAKKLTNAKRTEFFGTFPTDVALIVSMAYFHCLMKQHVRESRRMLKLAALIDVHDAKTAVALAQAYVTQGFAHLKIKVGGLLLDDEVIKIKTIAAIGGNGVKLRLDANRRYSFDEASTLLKGLKHVALEYFEEPTHEIERLRDLHELYGVPLAIDESLCSVDDLDWLVSNKIDYVIIKPGRFHNLFATVDLVNRAKELGLKPIFSHCYESEFSSTIFALMIDHLNLIDDAHGIVVDGIFRQGVFTQPLRSFRGQLSLDNAAMLSWSSFLQHHGLLTQVL